ncbi:hypothetical protein BJ875DRAFT_19580 [Amylocarpus encephaloides]|uniref:Aminoglycoside phosphotransferase domain-containing protein n=1 Tax=Amylocarpus encephaloides TaxID=45428 RepID=A0A9P8C566_9HELO|nr:hypothetical protein BJ875DRAFT_19580 [Amylocarpus encephaloides]
MVQPSHPKTIPTKFETSSSTRDFFARNKLPVDTLRPCLDFISLHYPRHQINPLSSQGFCSLTFLLASPETNLIVQFRPPAYSLDTNVARLASRIYPAYAPRTRGLGRLGDGGGGLLVYEMSRTPGISLQSLRAHDPERAQDAGFLARLVKDFAAFQVASYHASTSLPRPKDLGPVASSLSPRLRALHARLPPRFRSKTRFLLATLPLITGALPWVLTHGDLLPGNIMLSPTSGRLTGLVDWAESEVLPFGMSFYGLEELLGTLQPPSCFVYHPQSSRLRTVFWDELEAGIPGSREDNGEMRRKVGLARDLGVLLWFGIAFDSGAINRVISEGRDGDSSDFIKLAAFLGISEGEGESSREVERMDLDVDSKL